MNVFNVIIGNGMNAMMCIEYYTNICERRKNETNQLLNVTSAIVCSVSSIARPIASVYILLARALG
jgi:hypothetical protein